MTIQGTTTERVIAVIDGFVGEQPVTLASTWDELGLDSLDNTNLYIDLIDEFDIAIAEEDWYDVRGVADAVALIDRLR